MLSSWSGNRQHVGVDVLVKAVHRSLLFGDIAVQRRQQFPVFEQEHALCGDVGTVQRLAAGDTGREQLECADPAIAGGSLGNGVDLDPGALGEAGQQGQCRFELLLCAREGDRQSSRAAVGFLRGGAAGLTF